MKEWLSSLSLLNPRPSILQDRSYFREATRVGADELMVDGDRHFCAAVRLGDYI